MLRYALKGVQDTIKPLIRHVENAQRVTQCYVRFPAIDVDLIVGKLKSLSCTCPVL